MSNNYSEITNSGSKFVSKFFWFLFEYLRYRITRDTKSHMFKETLYLKNTLFVWINLKQNWNTIYNFYVLKCMSYKSITYI